MSSALKVYSFSGRTVRLISSANHKPPVLQPLAASYGSRTMLENLEAVTSKRQVAQNQGVPGIEPESLARGYGFTYVNAAFTYTRSGGNRFNSSEWGAWYSAVSVETSLREVSFHLTRALAAAGGDYDNITNYVELHATFDADFVDLRDLDPTPECLAQDTTVAYADGQKLASTLRKAGHNGLIYPSVRHPGGTCLVAFWPGLVRNFQQGASWELRWAGDPEPMIRKL